MTAAAVDWPEQVRAWRKSGLTAHAYCSKRGLNVRTLWSWSARMKGDTVAPRSSRKASKPSTAVRMALVRPAGRSEVAAIPVAPAHTGLRLHAGAIRVELERDFHAETLVRVLQLLEARVPAP